MNQLSQYILFVRKHSYLITLSEIMNTTFGCEYRKFHSLLRQDGWDVKVELNRKEPSKNLYKFVEPYKYEVESNGQIAFV